MSKKSFDGDLFERSKLADNLIDRLHGLSVGHVITIDAPWGDGKTFFATHLKDRLQERSIHSVSIDAFEFDYFDDPFVLLTSAIYSAFKNSSINSTNLSNFMQKAVYVGKKLIPSATAVRLRDHKKVQNLIDLCYEEIEKTNDTKGDFGLGSP